MTEITNMPRPIFRGGLDRSEAFEKYGKAATQAARTAGFQKAGQEALAGLMSVSYENGEQRKPAAGLGRPQLHPPPADGNKQEVNGDRFTLLMALISEMLGEVDNNKLKNRLAMLQSMASARQQGHEKLAAEYSAAVEALAAAEEAVDGSQERLEKLRERVQHFQGLLKESEARLAGLDPDSPEYASELARRDQLKGELADHTQAFQKATDAHLKLVEVANACAKTLAVVAAKVQEAGLGGSSIKESNEKALSSSALALLNRLKIIELLGDAAQNKEELNQELFLELQAKLQEHMKLESEKYLEEVRKAEALQKTMGCIGKIISAAVLVFAVVSLNPVLIGVSVGLMIIGPDIMAEVMKPLMAVMQEAIKLFSDVFTKLFGEDVGQILGMITGVLATVAAVAAVAIVGAQLIGSIISAIATRLTSMLTQIAPQTMQTLNQLATSVGNTLTRALAQVRSFLSNGADPVSLARFTARVETAQTLTEFSGVAVQGGLQIASGTHLAQAAEHLADVRVRMAISEEITSYLTRLVEDYGSAMQNRTRQIEQVMADLQRSHSVSLYMARHV
ncbi:type III secretion system translocon subunit SctE [Pseudomonas izuensis]|uniref:type III secretion system translocon subunit SctE n=1 Tax=Pseudomonas izuensis TaxID=2684212 RepID=UPI001356CE3E|nr:type III secretion system translocon subunit SctE [Pseudomonas izuensis]